MAGTGMKNLWKMAAAVAVWIPALWLAVDKTTATWDLIVLFRLGMLMLFPFATGMIRIHGTTVLFGLPIWLLCGLGIPYFTWQTTAQLAFLLVWLLLDGAAATMADRYTAGESFWLRWKRCFLPVCLSLLPSLLAIVLYDFLCTWLMPWYYRFFHRYGGGILPKTLLLCACTLVYTVLMLGLLRMICGRVRDRQTMTKLAEACQGVEGFLLGILLLGLLFLAVTEKVYEPVEALLATESAYTLGNSPRRFLWVLIQILVLSLHGLYVVLLIRSASVRKKLRQTQSENAALSHFTTDLEENLREMAGVRHDMKNLLLTMGGYVSRSGDREMQRFWQEQITPCFIDTIRSSETFAALRYVSDETLKSFLYYKCMQAAATGCVIQLDIQQQLPSFVVTGNLVRLLGIFLDNALEEAVHTDKEVSFSMTTAGEYVCIRVTNTVSAATRERGIHPGMSQKGEERGHGLQIAGALVAEMDGVTWNSWFREDRFTQLLCLIPIGEGR